MTEGIPTLTSGIPKVEWSAATRRSHEAAISNPAPRQYPLILAITGTGNCRRAAQAACKRAIKPRADDLSSAAISVDVSAADESSLTRAGQNQHSTPLVVSAAVDRG